MTVHFCHVGDATSLTENISRRRKSTVMSQPPPAADGATLLQQEEVKEEVPPAAAPEEEEPSSKPALELQCSYGSPCSSYPASPTHEQGSSSRGSVPPGGRRSLKNEDSSYDSDFESSEVAGLPPTEQHEDVCRTVSDTLGAEFAEYVTNTSTTTVLSTVTTSDVTPSSPSHALLSAASSLPIKAVTPPDSLNSSSRLSAPPTKTGIIPVDTITVTSIIGAVVSSSIIVTTTSATSTFPSVCKAPSSVPLVSSTNAPPSGSISKHTVVSRAPLTNTTSLPPGGANPQKSTPSTTTSTTTHLPLSSKYSSPAPSILRQHPPLSRGLKVTTSVGVYQQQVDFGIKLGYSEGLVQLALEKLGLEPSSNELLNELIRLGAGAPRPEGEEGATPGPASAASPSGGGTASGASGDTVEETSATKEDTYCLRPIIVDGSNVAMSHGNQSVFSCKGLSICVDWFKQRGHKEITVFVPLYRKELNRWDNKIIDQEVLAELEQEKVLVFTPSRTGHTSGRRIIPYDDRYILNEAVRSGGVVVSNDNFRDLANENQDFRRVVEEGLLMYSWVNGRFVPPDDPLGRNGPTLDALLRKPLPNAGPGPRDPRPCPYRRKCTYGNKCKYQHPERGAQPVKSVTERLQEQRESYYLDKAAKSRDSSPGVSWRPSVPACSSTSASTVTTATAPPNPKKPLTRTLSTVHSTSLSHDTSEAHLTPSSSTSCSPRPTTPNAIVSQHSTSTSASKSSSTSPFHQAPPPMHHHPSPYHPPHPHHMVLSPQPSFEHGQAPPPPSYDTFRAQPHNYPPMYSTQQQQQHSNPPPHQSYPSSMPPPQHTPMLQHPPTHHALPPHHGPPPPVHHTLPSHLGAPPPYSWGSPSRAYHTPPPPPPQSSKHPIVGKLSNPDTDNPHPVLERQLTLNPSNDHRLDKMMASHQKSLPVMYQSSHQAPAYHHHHHHHQQPSYGGSHYQQQQQQHLIAPGQLSSAPQRSAPVQQQYKTDPSVLELPGFTYKNPPEGQPPQSHHGGGPPAGQSSYSHPHVTRFSSAPDPIWGGAGGGGGTSQYQALPQITRLNSTSDPYLNISCDTSYSASTSDSPHYLSEPYDEQHIRGAPPASTSSPGPVGSRPMSPHQYILNRGQHPAAPPPPQSVSSPLQPPLSSFPPPKPGGREEKRSILYYHLISLFPEEAVLSALGKFPNETDATKICAAIIESSTAVSSSASNPPSGSEVAASTAVSSSGGSSHSQLVSCHSVPLPFREEATPISLHHSPPSFSPPGSMPHADSRLRDYMNPPPN